MSLRPKQPCIKLDPQAYEKLRLQVLKRDAWRCQKCGSMLNLEVHHKQLRSRIRKDVEQNLVTLCRTCHCDMHRSPSFRISS
jgi:5-methylcytosine-specific restriction endonuclease McrA